MEKLPLGIYKSVMAKAYRSLNNPIQYPYHNEQSESIYMNRHSSYSPLPKNEFIIDKNYAREYFFIDYLKDKL
jgi:hypothetical protein